MRPSDHSVRFNHEASEWPNYEIEWPLVVPGLVEAHRRHAALMARLAGLGIEDRSRIELQAMAFEVEGSSAIEGEHLSVRSIRTSIARRLGLVQGHSPPVDREVEGPVEIVLDAVRNHAEPLTAERLFAWHRALFPAGRSGLYAIAVGAWRDDRHGPMQVVSGPMGRETVHFRAPAAERVPDEMRDFLDWFNREDRLDGLVKAALAHLRFVTIHPFDDGNGRIGRAITEMALARAEGSAFRPYSLSARILRERSRYYDALGDAQRGTLDATDWIAWFLNCLGRALGDAEREVGDALARGAFWRNPALDGINPRQRLVLDRLLGDFEGKLTTTKWAKLAKCSQDTAYRDILDLVARGVLSRDEAGGRSTSYSLVAHSTRGAFALGRSRESAHES